jgi:hypothetical protein
MTVKSGNVDISLYVLQPGVIPYSRLRLAGIQKGLLSSKRGSRVVLGKLSTLILIQFNSTPNPGLSKMANTSP